MRSMLDEKKKAADRYLKRQVLGEGTYGVVYKAFDTMVFYFPLSFPLFFPKQSQIYKKQIIQIKFKLFGSLFETWEGRNQ